MNIWKFKKHITFWELLVLRCITPFAWMGLFYGVLGYSVLYNMFGSVFYDNGYFFGDLFINNCIELSVHGAALCIGVFGLFYANKIADRIEAKSLLDEAVNQTVETEKE
jgi:hypothetical protein